MSAPASGATSAPTPLFAGQAAAPPGPCDLTGMYVMHHAFRRDLTRLAAAAERTPPTDRRSWRALDRWWTRFAELLHEHHTKEDELLWPELLRRVDDDGRAVLVAMEAEHDQLDPLLTEVTDGLARLARGRDVDQAATAQALARLRDLLDQHLAHEEHDAVAVVQAHLDAAEWRALEDGGLAHKPGPPLLFFMLPWVADGLTDDDLSPLLGAGGAPVRVMMALGRPGYRRLARRAFRHLEGTAS